MTQIKFLNTFLNRIKLSQVISWISILMVVFHSSRKFFDFHYSQNATNRITQILLYCIIVGVFLFVLRPTPYLGIVKLLVTTFGFTVLMASIIYIVGKIIKSTRQGYLDVLSYVFITALYGIFFTYFFNDLFITNEDYTFRFIANCFTNFYLLVALFGYWIITRTNAKKTIFALLLTVLIMNLMLALGSIVTIDESNDSPEIDPFIAEINRSIEDIKDAPGLPYTRIITYESNKGKFDSVTFINIGHDTLFKYDEVGIKVFKEMALANIKKIDSASTKMQFKKTKDMFRYLREYHFLYATMFDYPPCDSCFVSGLRVMDKDSTLVKISKTYIIDSVYLRNRV